MKRLIGAAALGILCTAAALQFGFVTLGSAKVVRGEAALRISLEDRMPDGSLYTPNTQSFLRGQHWLDQVTGIGVHSDSNDIAEVHFTEDDAAHSFRLTNIPLSQLVPRLHYPATASPDAFDAFNLMMAEYSRNGMSLAVGREADTHAHFETTLPQRAPWTLTGDFEFKPDPLFRPVRVSLINNCLTPGLWEFNAVDRAGEVHHSWFDFPAEYYNDLTARTNHLPPAFVAAALQWNSDPAPLHLERLREVQSTIATVSSAVVTANAGYSSQGSRRKLSKGFAMVRDGDTVRRPTNMSELSSHPALLTDFVAPGRYDIANRKEFHLEFLAEPGNVTIRRVTPLTHYAAQTESIDWTADYLEFSLPLGDLTLVLGNLPIAQLVPQEELAIHGFGVGILPAADFAERRALLISQGPAPSFAFLVATSDDGPLALNSHERGVEQVFIRTHAKAAQPYFEVTITSFERIVDLARYRIDIPPDLIPELSAQEDRYISPLFLTYRDDNLR